jgi:predicted HicB family RNase H-like nuclease
MTKRVAQKKPTGGGRPGAGRPRVNRRAISARVSNKLYARLQQQAKKQETTLSNLIENTLEEKFS